MSLCCLCCWQEHGHPLSHFAVDVVDVAAVVVVGFDVVVVVVVDIDVVGFHHSSQ